jgi:hypothetical protein
MSRGIITKLPALKHFIMQVRKHDRNSRNSTPGVRRGAYMPSEDGVIYVINISGKVKRAFIERLAKDISKYLPATNVYRLYEKLHREAPDLVLESNDLAFSLDPTLPLKLKNIRATHAKEGIFIAISSNKVMNKGFKGKLHVYDITPTILYTLGMPIPSYFDGRIIFSLFSKEFLKETTPIYIPLTYNRAKLKIRIHRLKLALI